VQEKTQSLLDLAVTCLVLVWNTVEQDEGGGDRRKDRWPDRDVILVCKFGPEATVEDIVRGPEVN
jgi:hypothetical protein